MNKKVKKADAIVKIAEWYRVASKIDNKGDMHPAQENGTYVEGLIDAMLIVRGDVKVEHDKLVRVNK